MCVCVCVCAVICSDKTGTLTTNQMSAVQLSLVAADQTVRTYTVTGQTYSPEDGEVQGRPALDKALKVQCSGKHTQRHRHRPCGEGFTWEPEGWVMSAYSVAGTQKRQKLAGDTCAFVLCVHVQAAAEICAVCNEASIECKQGVYRAVGAPTEAALRVSGIHTN